MKPYKGHFYLLLFVSICKGKQHMLRLDWIINKPRYDFCAELNIDPLTTFSMYVCIVSTFRAAGKQQEKNLRAPLFIHNMYVFPYISLIYSNIVYNNY